MSEATELPQAARGYLEQLRLESGMLPQASREQLLGQIREHLTEAVDDGSEMGAVLSRLGSPRELVAEAHGDAAPSARTPTWQQAVLWCSLAGSASCVAGLLIMALGAALQLRSILFTPALILLVVGGTLLVAAVATIAFARITRNREQWRTETRDAAALQSSKFVIACTLLVLGMLAVSLGTLLLLVTGRLRALLLVIPGIVLAILGFVLLWRLARSKRPVPGATEAI